MYLGSNESSPGLDVPPVAGCDCCWVELRTVEGDSSTVNSLKNLTVASTSGVELLPVSGTPNPRCLFRSPSSLNRYQNGGEFTRSCKTTFAKHVFLVFASPRARRRGNALLLDGQEAGMEERMEVGIKCDKLEHLEGVARVDAGNKI